MNLTDLSPAPLRARRAAACPSRITLDETTESRLIAGLRQTTRCGAKRVARSRRIGAGVALATWFSVGATGCFTASLQPRTTLEGRPFDVTKADAVHVGLSEPDVREILGDPLQITNDGQQTSWRYYERFTPRGCNPPILSQEIRITFRGGVVVSSEAVRPRTWP
jgi:outer membrane protein assembly factor BamE (lipoprotein component of BamABCDE complex)